MGRYFEEFAIGERVEAPSRSIAVADIDGFAALTGDVNRLHVDDDFARTQGFRERILSV